MRTFSVNALTMTLAWIISLFLLTPAQAHLLVAQHGTLNIVDNGAFMVLSLPVHAFDGIDDDGDGEVSMVEFNHHRVEIVESVKQKVILSDMQGKLPLLGIMLSPVLPHDVASSSITQLTVLGRFSLNDADAEMNFYMGLHGHTIDEQSMEITVSRDSDNQKQVFEVSADIPTRMLFPEIQ